MRTRCANPRRSHAHRRSLSFFRSHLTRFVSVDNKVETLERTGDIKKKERGEKGQRAEDGRKEKSGRKKEMAAK